MKKLYLAGIFMVIAMMGHASAETAWKYSEVEDKFTDKIHNIASITNKLPASSESFKANFECRNGKDFAFSLYTDKNLGDRNGPLKIQYRVDDKRSKTVRMRIFSNSETGGMNKADAIDIANDVLNAERLRLRVIADNGDQFDAEISLENARRPILKTVEACGLYVRD